MMKCEERLDLFVRYCCPPLVVDELTVSYRAKCNVGLCGLDQTISVNSVPRQIYRPFVFFFEDWMVIWL